MLARGEYKGRAWTRTGRNDAPGQRSPSDAQYGVLPDELDHPEVWDDWSGGYGDAYRHQPNTYHWAENMDARFPRQLVHAQELIPIHTAASPYHINGMEILEVNVNQLAEGPTAVGAGDIVIQYPTLINRFTPNGLDYKSVDTGFDLYTYATGGHIPPTARPALFGSFIYYGETNASIGFWQGDITSNAGTRSAYGHQGFGFEVAGNRLWKFAGVPGRAVYLQQCPANTASGPLTAANWSATITIGNGWSGINDIKAMDDQLFAGTPEGVYAGDASGTFSNILSEAVGRANTDNCRDLDVFNGQLIIQTVGGVYSYQSSLDTALVRRIGPPATTNKSPIQGIMRAVKAHADWLYGGLWTGSQSYLMAAREGQNGWIWHPMQRLPSMSKVRRLYVDGITVSSGGLRPVSPRMWVLTEPSVNLPSGSGATATINLTATAPIYFIPTPPMNGNPLAVYPVFSPNYVGSARIDLGAVDWGAPGTPKLYRAVEVWADNLASAAQWADVYYTIDNGTRTKLGTTAKSPKDTLYFPSNTGSFLTGQSIALSLESFTASAGVTPIYRSIVLRGALQPRSVDLITAVVQIADDLRDRQGAPMRSGATMLQELRDFGNPDVNGLQAHQLIDLAGATSYVKLLGRVEEREIYQPGNEEPAVAATVRMAVLDYDGS
jgi:hypothetical protein